MISVVLWIAWLLALLVFEWVARRPGDKVYMFTTVVRRYMRFHWLARLSVFGLWLWLGFHFFVQR